MIRAVIEKAKIWKGKETESQLNKLTGKVTLYKLVRQLKTSERMRVGCQQLDGL